MDKPENNATNIHEPKCGEGPKCENTAKLTKQIKALIATDVVEEYFFDQFDTATEMVPPDHPARVVCDALEKARELIGGADEKVS